MLKMPVRVDNLRGPVVKNTIEWRLGQWGERHVRRWLERDCGLFVVPTSLIEDGGAPALTNALQRIVLPDLQAHGDSRWRGWCEVKTKTRAVKYNITQEWRHGIGARLWADYREVEQRTGMPGTLVILQCAPKMLMLVARMDALVPIPHSGSRAAYGGEELVFFRVDDFEWFDFVPDELPPQINPKVVRPWEVGATMGDRQLPLWGGEMGV